MITNKTNKTTMRRRDSISRTKPHRHMSPVDPPNHHLLHHQSILPCTMPDLPLLIPYYCRYIHPPQLFFPAQKHAPHGEKSPPQNDLSKLNARQLLPPPTHTKGRHGNQSTHAAPNTPTHPGDGPLPSPPTEPRDSRTYTANKSWQE